MNTHRKPILYREKNMEAKSEDNKEKFKELLKTKLLKDEYNQWMTNGTELRWAL
jgi:hypothetical protein